MNSPTTRERPIIFSAPMVRAILDGRKTQTRRVVNGLPDGVGRVVAMQDDWVFAAARRSVKIGGQDIPTVEECVNLRCPYGVPGDRLWVRETWQYSDWTEDGYPFVRFKADSAELLRDKIPSDAWSERLCDIWTGLSVDENFNIDGRASDRRWRPAIHMPRFVSRITLEITGVRVERVQEISEADAIAEGCKSHYCSPEDTASCAPGTIERALAELFEGGYLTAKNDFIRLWNELNENHGHGWAQNPWVWAITFKRVEAAP